MSAENVEMIKGLMNGFEGADADAIREMLPAAIPQFCDPEIEFIETPERVDATTYHGHEGVLEAFSRWLDQWDEYDAEAESFEDHGDDVFVVARERGRGQSGATVEARLYLIYTMRDGKILRYREFYDEDAARAALVG
jgi:ketosteroid isomerase-like protein